METESIELKIEFGLHKSCMGGRKGYGTGIRPNHWIPGRDYTFIGQVDFIDSEWVRPGEKCIAIVHCLMPRQDVELFKSGFTWHICEANKIMGYAKVL